MELLCGNFHIVKSMWPNNKSIWEMAGTRPPTSKRTFLGFFCSSGTRILSINFIINRTCIWYTVLAFLTVSHIFYNIPTYLSSCVLGKLFFIPLVELSAGENCYFLHLSLDEVLLSRAKHLFMLAKILHTLPKLDSRHWTQCLQMVFQLDYI